MIIPTPEMMEYAKAALEQAGFAEKARLQWIEIDRLEVTKRALKVRLMILFLAAFLSSPFIAHLLFWALKGK
jgi:hypothetical protein